MDNFAFVNLVGVALGLLLGVILLTESRRLGQAVMYLGLLSLIESITLFRGFISYSGLMLSYPHAIAVLLPLAYLKGPLLLMLIVSTLNGQLRQPWLHILPAVVSFCALLPVYALSLEEKIALYYVYHGENTLSNIFSQFSIPVAVNVFQPVLFGVVLLVYSGWSLKRIFHARVLRSQQFIAVIAMLMMLEAVFRVGGLGIAFTSGGPPIGLAIKIAGLLVVIAVYYKGIVILKQGLGPHPLSGHQPDGEAGNGTGEAEAKYARSGLDEAQRRTLLARFDDVMNAEQLYLDSDLTLAKLAARLDATPNRLSQALNEGRNTTYNESLARYRVEKSCEILADPAHSDQPIIEIALEAGFNDKSTFYRQFKRLQGKTPAAYRAEVQ